MVKQQEIVRIENLLKILKRGSFQMNGEEALAFVQCFTYLVEKLNELKAPPSSGVELPKNPMQKPATSKAGKRKG